MEADVIVVGCGIAGLSAAVSAHEAGAKVALLERAPKDQRGGNTRYTESFWRMKSENEVSDDFIIWSSTRRTLPILPRFRSSSSKRRLATRRRLVALRVRSISNIFVNWR